MRDAKNLFWNILLLLFFLLLIYLSFTTFSISIASFSSLIFLLAYISFIGKNTKTGVLNDFFYSNRFKKARSIFTVLMIVFYFFAIFPHYYKNYIQFSNGTVIGDIVMFFILISIWFAAHNINTKKLKKKTKENKKYSLKDKIVAIILGVAILLIIILPLLLSSLGFK